MDYVPHPGDPSEVMLEMDEGLGEETVMFVVETTEGVRKRFSVDKVLAIYINARGETPDTPH